ncbi:Glycosyl hydrolases family 28 [Verrucomicrobium sp. GAS474]|uniref:glycoside hydrolase family 28 protein n=1 Tax=Verrucomicrobium sp. GAS474 TaxID=1882831 RepID=UPI00087C6759|nr:glycoside hydrolase family 28 protein [Verrucomicrobium sp. GAS474]SDU27760.1 Glycosyl hydrolases family 28 [Verrucomicrobium sp. GAS474]
MALLLGVIKIIDAQSESVFMKIFRSLLLAGLGLFGWASLLAVGAHGEGDETRRFNVRDFGAVGDGVTKETLAIQKALDACAEAGGGEVLFPEGTYLTGSIELKSHVHLVLDAKAVLQGSGDKADYPLGTARWEGLMALAYLALLRADHAEDLAITGAGTIQGDAKIGTLRNPRAPTLIEFTECKKILLDGPTLHSTHIWTFHPTFCEDVTVRNLMVQTYGSNSDGVDPDSCRHVVIDNCTFETGDDNIAIKSGKGQEGVKVGRPCEDISITNCTFVKGAAAIALGSELSGGISNVRVSHCKFSQGWVAIQLKSRAGRAGYIRDFVAEDIDVGPEPMLWVETDYKYNPDPQGVAGPEGFTKFENIRISNARVNGKSVVSIKATPDNPADGIVLENITGTCSEPWIIKNASNVTLRDIHVSGFKGPFLSLENASGTGLDQDKH